MDKLDCTEMKDERIRGKVCELMSEMLDNPNEHGIYPTSEFMSKMETFILSEKEELETSIRDFLAYFDPEGGISGVPLGPFELASKVLGIKLYAAQAGQNRSTK